MSGHSKWHTIKHKKGIADAKRGQAFTKLIKELSITARQGGGDPDMNPRLRTVILKAKAANMPKDNIDRAIKKGTGELEGVSYEEILYEAYGPGGVAILIDILTDNKNRAAAEIRNLLNKGGGNLGAAGSVAYQFKRKGLINYDASKYKEDDILAVAIDAGAEDVFSDGDSHRGDDEPRGLRERDQGDGSQGVRALHGGDRPGGGPERHPGQRQDREGPPARRAPGGSRRRAERCDEPGDPGRLCHDRIRCAAARRRCE